MSLEARLKESFCCSKCRGREFHYRLVRLPAINLKDMLGHGDLGGKYYAVSCGLCGFTELYNAAVCEVAREAIGDSSPTPQQS